MRVELRRRLHSDHQTYHHDLVCIAEGDEESRLIDTAFGDKVGEDGLIAEFTGQVRLADGYGEHYLLLQPKVEP